MFTGFAPLGSHTLAGVAPERPSTDLVTVRVATTDVSGRARIETIRVRDELDRRNTAKVTIVDKTLTMRVNLGDELEIAYDTGVIFRGSIDKVEEEQPLASEILVIQVTAVDWTQLFDRFFVARTYEDMLAGDIVRSIISDDTPLDDEGVTAGGVEDGFTIDKITFDYEKASSALGKIAELGDWAWFIDHTKRVHFFDKTKFLAPNNFSSGDGRYASVKVTRDRAGYGNRIIVRGGKGVTETASTERFEGDGETQTFDLKLEAAKGDAQPNGAHPTIKVNDVETTKVGIRGVDDEDDIANFNWFWSPEEKEISQAPTLTALSDTDTLEVTYNGLFDIIAQAENPAAQAERVAIEGGSGIYELLEDEKSIDGVENISQRAEALLDQADDLPIEVRITTYTGLRYLAGQLTELDFPAHAVSGLWLIESVSTSFRQNGMIVQDLTLIDSGRISSATSFWRALEEQGREFTINEKQTLLVIKKGREVLTLTDTLTIDEADTLVDPEEDEYSRFLIGKSRIGGARIKGS